MRAPYVCLNCRLSKRINLPPFRRAFSHSPISRSDAPATKTAATIRPATAPKAIPNVKHIRQNAELHAQNCVDRNYAPLKEYPAQIRKLAEDTARVDHELRTPRTKIKQLEKSIGKLAFEASKKETETGQSTSADNAGNIEEELARLRHEAQELKDHTHDMVAQQASWTEEIHRLSLTLPNITSPETPIGDDPKVIDYVNYDPSSPPPLTKEPPRSHVSIGTSLDLLDFTSSASSTGWGWYFLTNEGALLEHALVQYALSVALRRGWKAVSPPSVVYSYIAEACGFQPRDANNEQQIWSIEQSETDRERGRPQRCLAGTAEIPLAAMYAGKDIDARNLPIKLVGSSRCYRAEAGARGVDTKGLYRVHEFTKVELFGWADNIDQSTTAAAEAHETSTTLFTSMLDLQTEILTSLNLPFRILEMPSTDLGASATRKQDMEAYFPSRRRVTDEDGDGIESAWGEVTSASICTDYQSRRLGTRVRGKGMGGSRYAHTVNGTAMAVPRVLAAILENGWNEKEKVVVVPEVLRGWMGGMEVIGEGRWKE